MSVEKSEGLPSHVLARLIDQGVLTAEHVTRYARPRRCRTCRTIVIAAIDDSGEDVRLWPHPTTVLGELDALVRDRRTWRVHEVTGRVRPRTAFGIRLRSAADARIHVEHRCQDPPPPRASEPPTAMRYTPTADPDSDPPF